MDEFGFRPTDVKLPLVIVLDEEFDIGNFPSGSGDVLDIDGKDEAFPVGIDDADEENEVEEEEEEEEEEEDGDTRSLELVSVTPASELDSLDVEKLLDRDDWLADSELELNDEVELLEMGWGACNRVNRLLLCVKNGVETHGKNLMIMRIKKKLDSRVKRKRKRAEKMKMKAKMKAKMKLKMKMMFG
jgi:hypothetical protein